MASEIELDSEAVLRAVYTWSEKESDPNMGRYSLKTEELLGAVKLPRPRLEDAVTLMAARGLIEAVMTLGGLQEVSPTAQGRAHFQGSGLGKDRGLVETSDMRADYEVFLSHSSLDDDLARDVKAVLEANGVRTFATPGSVPTGKWEPQIERALQRSTYIWVLLTQNALRQSVWTHHEFGYFYGYRHGTENDLQGRASRFLFTGGTELHGLYAEIQGVKIDSFEDPLLVAKVIAAQIGMAVTRLPEGFVHRKYLARDSIELVYEDPDELRDPNVAQGEPVEPVEPKRATKTVIVYELAKPGSRYAIELPWGTSRADAIVAFAALFDKRKNAGLEYPGMPPPAPKSTITVTV